jgi:ABC-type lipoprotein release transport system permease subunit
MDGSRRQLNYQATVFTGEVVVKLAEPVDNIIELIEELGEVQYATTKIRSSIQYRLSGSDNSATLIGVNLDKDKNLKEYLTLLDGEMLETERDILIPSSLLQKSDINIGGRIAVIGETSSGVYNTSIFRVKGIYNSPGLNLFDSPALLINYDAMKRFYIPQTDDIEYCVFYYNGDIPENFAADIRNSLDDINRRKISSIEAMRITSWDVMNISIQFNIFLVIMITITIVVLVTLVILVNFNIYMILYRKRRKEIGTFMAFGIKPLKIGIMYFLEAIIQLLVSVLIAVLLAFLTAIVSHHQLAGGFLEVLFVLLSGTNRIDFYIRFYQIFRAFAIIFVAVTIAQIPIFIKVNSENPVYAMRK